MRKLSFFIAFAFLVNQMMAQNIGWYKKYDFPSDAKITTMTHNPGNGDLYVGTSGNKLYRSQDKGNTWSQLSTNSSTTIYQVETVSALAYNEQTEEIVLGSSNGLYWSGNNGSGWEHECFYWSSGQTGGCTGITSIEALNTGSATFFYFGERMTVDNCVSFYYTLNTNYYSARSYFSDKNNNVYVIAYDKSNSNYALLKTTDGGVTWQPKGHLPHQPGTHTYSGASEGNGRLVIAINKSTQSSLGGLYESTDDGSTWTFVSTGITDSSFTDVVYDELSGTYYASSKNGIYESTDRVNWQAIHQPLPFNSFDQLMVDESGNLYATGSRFGLFQYNTSGRWTKRSGFNVTYDNINDLKIADDGKVWAYQGNLSSPAYLDTTSGNWSYVLSGIQTEGSVYGTKAIELQKNKSPYLLENYDAYTYNTSANSWNILPQAPVPQNSYFRSAEIWSADTFFTQHRHSNLSLLHASHNGGSNFMLLQFESIDVVDMLAVSGTTLFTLEHNYQAGFLFKRYQYQSGGWNIDTLPNPLAPVTFVSIPYPKLFASHQGNISLVEDGQAIHLWDNSAQQWNTLQNLPWDTASAPTVQTGFDFEQRGGNMYFAHQENGYFESNDNGATWTQKVDGLDFPGESIRAFDFDGNGKIFAVGTHGIYNWGAIPTDTSSTDTTGGGNGNSNPDPTGLAKAGHNKNIQIYYQPGSENIVVRNFTDARVERIGLYDLAGQRLENINRPGNQETLSVGSYNSGVYIVEVNTGNNKVIRRKIVKTE